MTRWLVLLLLCCAGMFLAGCDGQESGSTPPPSSPPGNQGEVGTPAAPPPPPPPPEIGGSNVPVPPTAGGTDSPAQQLVAMQQELANNMRQVVDLLSVINDESSARTAAPKLRQCAGDMKRLVEKAKLAMVSLSPQDLQRAIAQIRDSAKDTVQLAVRMEDEIVRVAAGPAAGAIGAEINELLDALDSGVAPPGSRQRLEEKIQKARGGR